MIGWLHLTLVIVSAGILAFILLLILRRWLRPKTRENVVVSEPESDHHNLQNGIAMLHHHDSKKPNNYQLFKRGFSKKPAFSWADHPTLVTEAVENGWSRFAFTSFISSSPSVKSTRPILSVFGAGSDSGNDKNVEISWEVCEGSADFMQKVRLNPKLNKIVAIRTGLPLPGPNLGNSSFPQEAYFEITILASNEHEHDQVGSKGKSEGDKIKLIGEDFNAKNSPDSVIISSHSQRRSKIEEVKIGKNEGVLMCVGLTGGGGGFFPGSYPGSIGFNSSGSVYLDGTKLVFESEKHEWGRTDQVIGCGYNPVQEKVFFTVDSQIMHEIYCKNEDFGSPLYPTLAANTDVTVLVNLGQSPFKYAPGNQQRTPNPCFIGPLGTSPVLGYEDSRELFSMGRIDSQWLQRSATRSNNNTVNSIKAMEYDQESEGDLFEIVLDSTGRSPYSTVYQ